MPSEINRCVALITPSTAWGSMPRKPEDRDFAAELARKLGGCLRSLRLQAGFTQDQLAEEVDLTSEAFGRIERGVALPSFPTFIRLCSALKADPNTLLGFEKIDPSTIQPEPAEVQQLLRCAKRLEPKRLKLVTELVVELAS